MTETTPRLPARFDGPPDAGGIEFGRSNVRDAEGREMLSGPPVMYRPREGTIFLFPSYLWHRTIPFEGGEERISVAFDVITD